MAKAKIDPIIRFSSKYVVDQENGCWNWIATLNNDGYGKFRKSTNEYMLSHRFSYEYFIGPLIKGFVICHKCENPRCVNPDHLRQDTMSSNMIDMVNSGNQGNQKLSVSEVIEIKKELKFYYRGQFNDLAHFYKVDRKTISYIKTGKIWSHVVID